MVYIMFDDVLKNEFKKVLFNVLDNVLFNAPFIITLMVAYFLRNNSQYLQAFVLGSNSCFDYLQIFTNIYK